MTTRQREFCHHYAKGIPASKAAHAAGYAKSTAEHNAALLLRNPHVIYTITLMQQGTREQVIEIFHKAKKRACHTLDYDSSDKAVESASREMRHWCKILLTLPPDRSLLPPLEESTQDDEPPVVGPRCARPNVWPR